jgi:hypothetical protein
VGCALSVSRSRWCDAARETDDTGRDDRRVRSARRECAAGRDRSQAATRHRKYHRHNNTRRSLTRYIERCRQDGELSPKSVDTYEATLNGVREDVDLDGRVLTV